MGLSAGRMADAGQSFPALIRLADFHAFVSEKGKAEEIPADWVVRYLADASEKNGWKLAENFFAKTLEGGLAMLLLDGLDEGPDQQGRERLARWIERLPRRYPKCAIVATSRPAAYAEDVVVCNASDPAAADDIGLQYPHLLVVLVAVTNGTDDEVVRTGEQVLGGGEFDNRSAAVMDHDVAYRGTPVGQGRWREGIAGDPIMLTLDEKTRASPVNGRL
jgi:hypothetical protein